MRECLALLDLVRDQAEHPDEVEMAIWLHDVVYVPWRHDNERRSAELAVEWLTGCGADTSMIERVRALILSTRHVEAPVRGDERLICDIDLGILGADPDRFDEYEAQVRSEYRRVPSPVFRSRRRKILASFLDRASIYGTPWFLEHRERAARRNLERALARLRGRTA